MFCHFTEYFGGQFYNYIDDIDYMNVKITCHFNKSEVSKSLTEFTICNNKEI